MRAWTSLVVAAGVVLGLLPVRAAEPTQRDLLEAVERQLKAVHATAGPATACVVVSRSDKYPKPAKPADYPGRLGGFDPAALPTADPAAEDLARQLDLSKPAAAADHGCAGGVVVDAAGLVLVNYHAIDGATKIYVHLPGGKGSYADIHAADARSDLAVLKLITPPAGLKAIAFGVARLHDGPKTRATVFPGKLAVVLTNPLVGGAAADRARGVLGSVTGVRPPPGASGSDTSRSAYNYTPLLEFDARSSVGCSGAAVVNLDGELIGLTTTVPAVAGAETGPVFALPLDDNFRRIVDVLRRGEEVEYGFLGVALDTSKASPIVISSVSPRSPAEAARLEPGETITRINGAVARHYPDLLFHIGSALAGNKVRLTVRNARGADEREVEVTLAKFRGETPYVAAVRPAPVFGLRVDYESTHPQPFTGAPPGVVVRELIPDSPAAAKFKAAGDGGRVLITAVNGTRTPNPAAFYKAATGQAAVKLTVFDPGEGTPRTREVTLP
jgi:serine protease Do